MSDYFNPSLVPAGGFLYDEWIAYYDSLAPEERRNHERQRRDSVIRAGTEATAARTGRNLKPGDYPIRGHEYERGDERPGMMQGEPPCGICGEPRGNHAGWGNRS